MANARHDYPTLQYASSALAACRDADVVLHLTEWQEFRDLDPAALATVATTLCVVDGRNALDAARWRAAGWQYQDRKSVVQGKKGEPGGRRNRRRRKQESSGRQAH